VTEHETLADLLAMAKVRHNGASGRDLARRATDHGLQISHASISALAGSRHRRPPGRQVLEAVAWLAGVPIARAERAAGLPVSGRPFVDELPDDIDRLGRRERDALLAVARAFLEQQRETPAPPMTGDAVVHQLRSATAPDVEDPPPPAADQAAARRAPLEEEAPDTTA